MTVLKAYVHALFPSGQVAKTEHVTLGEWQDAVGTAWERAASHVLLDAGFSALPDDHVLQKLPSLEGGIYLTPAAFNIRPLQWLHPVEVVDGGTGLFRAVNATPVLAAAAAAGRCHVPMELRPMGSSVEEPGDVGSSEPEANGATCFSSYLKLVWTLLNDDDSDVIKRRWGYDGASETLEQIAASRVPTVSRERIRQIEARALKKVAGMAQTDAMLARLANLVRECALPLPLQDLSKLDAWFDLAIDASPWFDDAIRALADEALDFVEVDDTTYLVPFRKAKWEVTVKDARALLKDLAVLCTPVLEVERALATLAPDGDAKYASLLWDAASRSAAHVATGAGGQPCLVAFGVGAKEAIRAVLFEAEEPLHRDEIVALAHARSGRDITDMAMGNAIPEVGLLMARGYYGSRRHIPLSDDEIASVVAAAEEVVLTSPVDRQWSNDEIYAAVCDECLVNGEQLGPYMLAACLRHQGTKLRDLGRGMWSAGESNQEGRLYIRDFIVELLRDAGRPMTTDEIKTELRERRGLATVFQIQPRDPLVRVGTATWGLIDRDLPVSMNAVTACLDAIKAHLLRTGEGLHVSEVLDVLRKAALDVTWVRDPELFLALAQRGDAMRATSARYLVLRDWADERRLTPGRAVLQAVNANPARSAAELAQDATVAARREIGADIVRSVLNVGGFQFDRAAGRWDRI